MKALSDSFFKDKVAIVTGSSMGIGKAIAEKLGSAGASVVLNGRNPERLKNCAEDLLAKGYSVHPVIADITLFSDCERLLKETLNRFGRLDILVNNAGTVGFGPVESFEPSLYRQALDSNIYGAVFPAMACIPQLRKTGGSVIFISSLAGLLGMPNYSAYSAGKMALTALSQSLRTELTGSGIHVGIVYVSFTTNEPEKRFISPDGTLVPVPPRKKWTQQSREKVAGSIVTLIRKRKPAVTLSIIGKLYRFLIWLSPSLAGSLIRRFSKNG